jgi:subtilisin family serine protease
MFVTIFFSFITSLFAFSPAAEPAERWLIELKSADPSCLNQWWQDNGLANTTLVKKPLRVGNWWVIEIPQRMSDELRQQSCIARMSPDKKIDWRKQPNDPAYINQGDMNLIGMPKAWDITTGGVTAAGDTIVVALIDDGFDWDHQDLAANVWINHLEIAGDGIDNDLNGYIDDRRGYNVSTDDDSHAQLTHGTSVAGIVGAKGNNGIGVTGVNWDVRLMLVSGADFESEVIEAYQYVLDQRILYEQTDRAKGAFVVVANLSGGINNEFAADHPLWCEMYDKLGEKGVLSVAAAPNNDISVDVSGDMPTTCTSPYLITVTNVDLTDVIVGNAGFGAVSIDIGAPGHGTVTTIANNQYKEFQGTSASAPHVAGAVALMYSTPCAEFLYDLNSDPSTTASRVRNIILGTGKDNNSLNEITFTGKRLQVDAALRATVTDCGGSTESEVQILSIRPNPAIYWTDVKVYFKVTGDITGAYFEIFDAVGKKIGEIPVDIVNAADGYIELDSRSLLPGVYFITLQKGDIKVAHKLVMVN